MRIVAFIMIVSTGFLGLNRFMAALDWMAPQTELSCNTEFCCSHDECCCDDQENENQCPSGCDCSYSIQIIALGSHIQSPIELSPQAFDHGSYHDQYYFEYQPPHFQPPRIA